MTGPRHTDLFAVLGVPRSYALDPAELERQFHARSRVLHPDRHARATPAERRAALERTTRLNEAYRVLRDPWRRAEHLVALRGGAGGAVDAGAAFLGEQLEVREALAAARARRDAETLRTLARTAREALAALEAPLADALAEEASPADALAAARTMLARARYHQAVLAEAGAALESIAARA